MVEIGKLVLITKAPSSKEYAVGRSGYIVRQSVEEQELDSQKSPPIPGRWLIELVRPDVKGGYTHISLTEDCFE